MSDVNVTVMLPNERVEALRAVGEPSEVLAELADHAQQAVTRPGSWERAWLTQAFGDAWTAALEQDPDVPWRQRPRR